MSTRWLTHRTLNAALYYSIKIKAAIVLNFPSLKSEQPGQGKAKQISICRGKISTARMMLIREACKQRFAWHVLTRIKLHHVKRSVEQLYYWYISRTRLRLLMILNFQNIVKQSVTNNLCRNTNHWWTGETGRNLPQ